MKDAVAIAGVGGTPSTRGPLIKGLGRLAVEACVAAVQDAGLSAADIDGVACTGIPAVPTNFVVASLGLRDVTWWDDPVISVFGFAVAAAAHAVHSGQCRAALACHTVLQRLPSQRARETDPLRFQWATRPKFKPPWGGYVDETALFGTNTYSGWMGRYMHEYGVPPEAFGRLAINERSNAARNPNALYRDPLTMEQYLASPYVREPMRLLDMDASVDAAIAVVVTTTDRARGLRQRPVLLHACTFGMAYGGIDDHMPDLSSSGQAVAIKALWSRSDYALADVDVFLPYDGFSFLALSWIENVGYCARGEAGDFMAQHWNADRQRIEIDGRIPVNPHGGSLSEGATTGAGHFREAVLQLRGAADDRQAPGASVAVATPGGHFFNSQAFVLRADG